MNDIPRDRAPKIVRDMKERVEGVLGRPGMRYLANQKRDSFWTREKLDLYFRGKEADGVRMILDTLYMLEALRVIGNVAKEKGLVFPVFVEESRKIEIEGLFHLLVWRCIWLIAVFPFRHEEWNCRYFAVYSRRLICRITWRWGIATIITRSLG